MNKQLDTKAEAQKLCDDLAGARKEPIVIVGVWQEPSTWTDKHGNGPEQGQPVDPVIHTEEHRGTILVSNGRHLARGQDLREAVHDLVAHVEGSEKRGVDWGTASERRDAKLRGGK